MKIANRENKQKKDENKINFSKYVLIGSDLT